MAIESKQVRRHERIDAADVLRGFAVMAIILLHSIEHFNFYSFPQAETQSEWLNFTDKAIWDGLFFMFGGKAYAIFALLFGFSFFIQHDNQRLRGNDFRLRFCWRLLLLFLVGQVNAAFFTGEVLVMYALIGFVLVVTCRMSTKLLMILSAICMLQPVCIYQVVRAVCDPSYIPFVADTGEMSKVTFAAQSSASFIDMVKVNLWEGQIGSLAWAWDNSRIFQTAGLFIAGMLIGREGWFLRRNLNKWGYVLSVSLCCFFPIYGLNNMVGDYIESSAILIPLKLILTSLFKLFFMFILVSGVLYGYYCTKGFGCLLDKLRPYGRMSMTNYVTQGIVGSAIFYHWGMHLQIGITGSVFIGIAIFAVQYVLCSLWLRHHNHGPLEYLWKKATWIEWPFGTKSREKTYF